MTALLSIIAGVFVAIYYSGLSSSNAIELLPIVYHGVKSFLIIILLIAAAKYCFNLGKAYMNESLKNSDRRHAIAFGEFYLRVYNSEVNPSELKEIFRDWNIVDSSSFISQTTNDFDPAILDKVSGLIEKIKSFQSGK